MVVGTADLGSLVVGPALPCSVLVGTADLLRVSKEHVQVLERFGRFPKRNAALGRESTPEELAYMAWALLVLQRPACAC